eukprot:2062899-Prymnesium_polylepis.1
MCPPRHPRDLHPRVTVNRAPPSSSHTPPVKPLVLVHRTTLFPGCIARLCGCGGLNAPSHGYDTLDHHERSQTALHPQT